MNTAHEPHSNSTAKANNRLAITNVATIAFIVLLVSSIVTALIFLFRIQLTTIDERWFTIVRNSGETYRIESNYNVEIENTWLIEAWSNVLLLGYLTFALSPLGVFVFTVASALRLEGTGPNLLSAYNPLSRIKIWLGILIGWIPSLVVAGVYLYGTSFQIYDISVFSISVLELIRLVLTFSGLLLIWWSMNFIAAMLGVVSVAVLREKIIIIFVAPIILIFLLITAYLGAVIAFSSASVNPINGFSEYALSEISLLPMVLCVTAPLGISLLFSYLISHTIKSKLKTV